MLSFYLGELFVTCWQRWIVLNVGRCRKMMSGVKCIQAVEDGHSGLNV